VLECLDLKGEKARLMAYGWWQSTDAMTAIFNMIYDSALFRKAFNR